MVLTSQFVAGDNNKKNQGPGYLVASLSFMVEPSAENKTALSEACVTQNPGRATELGTYFSGVDRSAIKVEAALNAAPVSVAAAPVKKSPGTGMKG